MGWTPTIQKCSTSLRDRGWVRVKVRGWVRDLYIDPMVVVVSRDHTPEMEVPNPTAPRSHPVLHSPYRLVWEAVHTGDNLFANRCMDNNVISLQKALSVKTVPLNIHK